MLASNTTSAIPATITSATTHPIRLTTRARKFSVPATAVAAAAPAPARPAVLLGGARYSPGRDAGSLGPAGSGLRIAISPRALAIADATALVLDGRRFDRPRLPVPVSREAPLALSGLFALLGLRA